MEFLVILFNVRTQQRLSLFCRPLLVVWSLVVNIHAARLEIKLSAFYPHDVIYLYCCAIFQIIRTTNSHYFPTQHLWICSAKRKACVLCDVRTEYLYVM